MADTSTSRAAPPLYVRAWRQYRALSQADLAELAGMTREAITRLENSQRPPRPSTIRKLAQALGIAPHELAAPPPAYGVQKESTNDGDRP
jgi:transcriptional regulator with XRE-family HTH domain